MRGFIAVQKEYKDIQCENGFVKCGLGEVRRGAREAGRRGKRKAFTVRTIGIIRFRHNLVLFSEKLSVPRSRDKEKCAFSGAIRFFSFSLYLHTEFLVLSILLDIQMPFLSYNRTKKNNTRGMWRLEKKLRLLQF